MDGFDQFVDSYHAALGEFITGDARPALQLFSQHEDVTLCNPFLRVRNGDSSEVADTAAQAASHFADGHLESEKVRGFATAEFAYTVEIERFTATVDGNEGSGALRVTTIFRLEDDGWRIVHRHTDPITTPQATESILQR